MLPSSQLVEIWKQSFDALSTLQLNGADICAMRVFAVILFYGLVLNKEISFFNIV